MMKLNFVNNNNNFSLWKRERGEGRTFSKEPLGGRLHLFIREQSVLKRVFTICRNYATARNCCVAGRDRSAIFLLSLFCEGPLFTDVASNVSPALKPRNKSFEFVFFVFFMNSVFEARFCCCYDDAWLKCKSIHLSIGHTRAFMYAYRAKNMYNFLCTLCS